MPRTRVQQPEAAAAVPEPGVGAMVGPYRIESVLGRGGMGVVFRATGPRGPAAVKMLHGTLMTEDMQRRFHREAAVRIEHPNVIRVLDAGLGDAGAPYIAFELLQGETLETRLQRGPLSSTETVEIGVQACEGLQAIHAMGLVHRDLKPANLFIDDDGVLKILDFGVAAITRPGATRYTAAGLVVGTPDYLAPEQGRGDIDVDARCDLWALGIVLYECLAGEPPYRRGNALATVVALLSEPLPSLRDRVPGCPDDVVASIERCLRRDRELRWSNALELEAALQSASTTPSMLPPELDGRRSVAFEPAPIPADEQRVVAILLCHGVRSQRTVGDAIQRYGGRHLAIHGNRALGLFGTRSWEGNEIDRATRAGLDARPACAAAAVAAGRVHSQSEGVTGEGLILAEAGCSLGAPGVAIDPDSARSLDRSFFVQPLPGSHREVVGALDPDGLPAREGAIPLVGRTAEITTLQRVLEIAVEESRASVAWISGPPGIGKSRLLRRLEQLVPEIAPAARVLRGRGSPDRHGVGLSLLTSTLWAGPSARRLRLAETLDERQRAVHDLVAETIDDPSRAAAAVEVVGELLDVPMPSSASLEAARRDPELMADRLRVAFRDYFDSTLRQGPLVLLLDDLQWADPSSLALIDALLAHLADRPLALFAFSRTRLGHEHVGLFDAHDPVKVELRGLSRAEVGALAAAVAGRPLVAETVAALASRSAGNPLFVEHTVASLRDHGELDARPEELPLPVSVEAVLQSRLDALPVAEKALCKQAAVLGRSFSADDMVTMGSDEAGRLIGSLVRRQLLVVQSGSGSGSSSGSSSGFGSGSGSDPSSQRRYGFQTTLLADVTYRLIGEEALRDLHRRAGELCDQSGEPAAEEAAGQYERAGDTARAAARFATAAEAAARRGDGEAVLRCSGRALRHGVSGAVAFGLHVARAEVFRYLGRRDAQWSELEKALEAAASTGEQARVLTERAAWMSRLGRGDEATLAAREAVQLARRTLDVEVLALALGGQAVALAFAGDLDGAGQALGEALALAGFASERVQALAAGWRGQIATARGDLAERWAAFEEARDRYEAVGDLRRAAAAQTNLADAYNRIGAFEAAAQALHAAAEKCRRVDNRRGEAYALLNLGYALAGLRREPAALEALARAEQLARPAKEPRLNLLIELYRLRATMASSQRPHDVAADADSIAAEAAERGLPAIEAAALALGAQASLACGATDQAMRMSTRAMGVRDRLGGLEEDEAEVYLAHADVLTAAGRTREAAAVLEAGRHRLEDIAGRIADLDWRRRFLAEAPANYRLMIKVAPAG